MRRRGGLLRVAAVLRGEALREFVRLRVLLDSVGRVRTGGHLSSCLASAGVDEDGATAGDSEHLKRKFECAGCEPTMNKRQILRRTASFVWPSFEVDAGRRGMATNLY